MDLEFDPDSPASEGLFGLPCGVESSKVAVLPVPVEATTSSAGGTADAPEAVLRASWQVDLCHPQTNNAWTAGFAMDNAPLAIRREDEVCREIAGRARAGDLEALERINRHGRTVAEYTETWTSQQFEAQRIPAILGGDHSVPLGAIRAAAKRFPGLGILHIDAHADLREAYEGFEQSHASIFYNALQLSNIDQLVQVGIRDFGVKELELAQRDPRIHQWTDGALADHSLNGKPFNSLCEAIIQPLPQAVWISWDIDGLDPALCPATGTPVPGGLSWREALALLETLGRSGRTIVGFDLVEVGSEAWDANVGARLLHNLCCWAVASQLEPKS